MSEFKAQILGIIIVLGLFVFVNSIATDIFDITWGNMEYINSVNTEKVAEISLS